LREAIQRTEQLTQGMEERLLSGGPVRVTLWGRPNAGKSTLLNALVGDSMALVSDQAGTTRDVIRVQAQWDGIQIEFADTAGISGTLPQDSIMQRADSLAQESRASANLCILCVDCSRELENEESAWIAQAIEAHDLVVATKGDRPAVWQVPPSIPQVSALSGIGIDVLRKEIVLRIRHGTSSDVVGITAVRCRVLAQEASRALRAAHEQSRLEWGDELVASEIWNALNALGEMIGDIYTDDLLDRIFSRFCIGK
jgi:tRNA modification GTPase